MIADRLCFWVWDFLVLLFQSQAVRFYLLIRVRSDCELTNGGPRMVSMQLFMLKTRFVAKLCEI